MDLGTGLFTCQQRPDDGRDRSALYAEMLDLVETVEDAGLDSAWLSEHHFTEDGYLSGVEASLGALAATTDEIEIGTCIALAPLYDPVRLAENVATVDQIAGGRTTLGLAVGYTDREFEGFGVPREERGPRTEDAIATLRAAWSPGPLDYDPAYHPISPDVTVTPKPASDVPLMLGGSARPAVRRAARLGDAWCAPSSLSIDEIRLRVDDIERVREAEGLDGDFQVYVLQHGFVADSREEAWEQMRDGYFYMLRQYAALSGGDAVDELPAEEKQAARERAVFGTPDQVAEDLEEYREALGDDVHVILRTYYPGAGTDAMAECIRRLGTEVRPQFD